jgi:two-component system nitrate/nitrite response regulator NarL
MVRVLAADAHPLYRDAVARVVHQQPALELVAELADGSSAADAIARLRPDVAVLDPAMPGLDGARLVAGLARAGLPTRVIMLSADTRPGVVYRALAAGAHGYLSKRATKEEIEDAISRAARGETVIARDVQSGVADEIRVRERVPRPILSPRERQIVALMADGLSAPEIGRRLYLGTATVKTHMLHVYEKLGVSERAAAVAQAIRRGLVD